LDPKSLFKTHQFQNRLSSGPLEVWGLLRLWLFVWSLFV